MDDYLKELEMFLKSICDRLENELRTVRSNRPSVGLVEDIKVVYYDQPMTVKQLGSLGVRPPRDIEITVWDKGAIAAILKAVESASAGFSVSSEGNVVRVSLPPLTDERRAELSKLVKKMVEESRIQLRNRRDETIKKMKLLEDQKQINEDQLFKAKERIQKIMDDANGKVELLLSNKLKEISE